MIMKRVLPSLLAGLAVAILGVIAGVMPTTHSYEEYAGLHTLFDLRGPRPAPPEVVVVSLDKESGDVLGLPNNPARWPRPPHATLVERLAAQGAELIAFDVLFDEHDVPAGDGLFGLAIHKAGNVILTGFLQKSRIGGTRDGRVTVTTASMVPPIPVLADSALAVAPFTLPVVPVKVSQFWTYKDSAGGLPTLPAVVFQAWMLRQSQGWYGDLRKVCPAIAIELPATQPDVLTERKVERLLMLARACLSADPAADRAMRDRWAARLQTGTDLEYLRLRALLRIYQGPATRFLNFYGPPRSITTVPYHQVLDGNGPDMRGRIVFVGLSEQFQPEQRDGFHTVYSDETGLDLSGVEIAATAVANMLEGATVNPMSLGSQLVLLTLWGLLTGALCRLLPPLTAVLFCALAAPLYLTWALWVFDATNNWQPIVVPLAVQLPVALLIGLLAQNRQMQSQRQRVIKAVGAYLPQAAVDQLMENMYLTDNAQLLFGTCLATDGEQYTRLAETLTPDELAALMNQYYDVMFAEVDRAGGVVADIAGDAMMAIWATAQPSSVMRARACHGALSIANAIERFNLEPGRPRLPTRIGLHSGPIRLGNVGSARHVQYRAIGDIVNTASRIEGLNKLLGTRILMSGESLEACEGFMTREVGCFLLAGKSTPITVHELLGIAGSTDPRMEERHALFAEALAVFRSGDWARAGGLFAAVLLDAPEDGPSRYYVRLCARYQRDGADTFHDGAVRVGSTKDLV